MNCTDITASGFQVSLIRGIKNSNVLIENAQVFLFKHLPIFAKHFISICIILTVFRNLVDKEQGKGLDPHIEQFFFLLEMRKNRFTNLNPTHIRLRHITGNLTGFHYFTVGKSHCATEGINIRNCISLVLLHFLRHIVEVIPDTKDTSFTVNGLVISDFKFNPSHRRLFRRENNLFQKQIAVCSPEVLYLKSFDLNFLDQTLIEGIQRIQHINSIVLNCMSCRIIQAEQRIKVLQRLLGNSTAHFLRLVQNDNGSVRLDNINRTARTKLITLGVNNASFLALAILF